MDTWTYWKKKKKPDYLLIDQEWTWTSSWRTDKDHQSKRYTHSPRMNQKNSGTTSSRTKNADGEEKPTETEELLSCLSKSKTEILDYVLTTEHSTMSPRMTDTDYH